MPQYSAPGVYVEEVPSGPRPIGAVGTSTAAFLGQAPQANAYVGQARAVNTWTDFTTDYVGTSTRGTDLSNAMFGYFANGGGRCYVVNLGPPGSAGGPPPAGSVSLQAGLQQLEALDEVTIVAAPGMSDLPSYTALIAHCEDPERQDRVAILDPPSGLGRQDIERLTRVIGGPGGPSNAPGGSGSGGAGSGSGGAGPGGSGSGGTGSGSGGPGSGGAGNGGDDSGLRPPNSDGGYATFYFPRFTMLDPLSGTEVSVPPSGHMAGIWAQTDTSRGVHKAPANVGIATSLALEYQVSRGEQELLNPHGVNCIRFFPATGIRVWGARTLADEASEWRYINVRRLVNMIKESIVEGTRWIVFEPNSPDLWQEIRRDIGDFLTRIWEDGALFGASADEAFYVKCDAETNPPDARDNGEVRTIIGIAPVKPAEFVEFKLTQSALTSEAELVGG